VDTLRRGGPQAKREALEQLLRRYLAALQAHLVRARGLAWDESEDVIQEFVADKILEKDLVSRADRGLGKFRTFLLTSLDRFLVDRIRRSRAAIRSPSGGELVSIGEKDDGLVCDEAPADPFDVAWAQNVVAEALDLMHSQCEASGRLDVWGVFKCRLVDPIMNEAQPVEYQELIERFDLKSPAQASNVLVTAKRMYARALRTVVAEYAADDEEMESEIRELREVLARSNE